MAVDRRRSTHNRKAYDRYGVGVPSDPILGLGNPALSLSRHRTSLLLQVSPLGCIDGHAARRILPGRRLPILRPPGDGGSLYGSSIPSMGEHGLPEVLLSGRFIRWMSCMLPGSCSSCRPLPCRCCLKLFANNGGTQPGPCRLGLPATPHSKSGRGIQKHDLFCR